MGGLLTRVRPIRQQESDDRCSQSLRLAEWSAQQRVKCNSIPTRLSVWNTIYALLIELLLLVFRYEISTLLLYSRLNIQLRNLMLTK